MKASSTDKAINGLTNGVSKVAVDDTPRVKSKNLDVLAEFEKAKKKNAANFVVIGKYYYEVHMQDVNDCTRPC